MRRFTFIFSILFVLLSHPGLAEPPKRVLILPLDIHAEKDLTFLQKGIEDMLSTRLFVEGKIVPVGSEEMAQLMQAAVPPIDRQTAIALGARAGVDYVIFGSLTVFGDSISTDTRFLDIQEKKTLVTFNEAGETQGDVISHIDRFAAEINATIFGRKTAAIPSTAPSPQQDIVPDSRQHPEKLLNRGITRSSDYTGLHLSGLNTAFSFWKSPRFKTKVTGMAVGDVEGDGKNEVVLISDQKVIVCRYADQQFERIAEIPGDVNDTFIGVETADVNNNGKSEIFVTNIIRKQHRLRSFVLEWNGTQFDRIADKENWYFRVLEHPARGTLLLGQRRGSKKLFQRNIYELVWRNNGYEEGEPHPLPKGINIYGFNYGDVLNNGEEMIIAFSDDGHVRILNQNGGQEWKGSERFGGSATYLELPSEGTSSIGNYKEMDRYYLAQRIHVADLDRDGKTEVIVINNSEIAGRRLSRFRMFSDGHLECFSGNQLGLVPKWRTQKVSGYISDHAIADLDNDGQDELVYAVASKTAPVVGMDKSFIVAQEVTPPEADTK